MSETLDLRMAPDAFTKFIRSTHSNEDVGSGSDWLLSLGYFNNLFQHNN